MAQSRRAEEPSPEEKLLTAIFGEKATKEEAGYSRGIRIHMAEEPTLGEVIEFLTALRGAYAAIDAFFSIEPSNSPVAEVRSFTAPGDLTRDLILTGASFNSPGFWEFVGNLNPLKVLCDYLQQRHERAKDRRYRNRAEEERLDLENGILRNQLVKERLEILRNAGVSDQEIQEILKRQFVNPLTPLGEKTALRLIAGAEISEVERKKSA